MTTSKTRKSHRSSRTPSHHRSRLIRKRGKPAGSAPGTLVHVGEQKVEQTELRLIRYSLKELDEQYLPDVSLCRPDTDAATTEWFNVDAVHNPSLVRTVGEQFGLHRLVMEDIVNTDQRPKMERYEGQLYIVARMLQFDETTRSIRSEQISFILASDYLLTFQEQPGDVFDAVRARLRGGKGSRIRQSGPDYLAYALVDAIVDHYFLLLEKFGDEVEKLEEDLLHDPDPSAVGRIHHFRREMLLLRKAVWPLREVLNAMLRDEQTLITEGTRVYLRDVYDHTIHIIDNIETLRDLLASLLDLHLSSASQRMNEIMKVLTIFAAIFMPLTFIAGVYGMNFLYMPELEWRWGYPLTLAGMAVVGAGLAGYFRWRKWL